MKKLRFKVGDKAKISKCNYSENRNIVEQEVEILTLKPKEIFDYEVILEDGSKDFFNDKELAPIKNDKRQQNIEQTTYTYRINRAGYVKSLIHQGKVLESKITNPSTEEFKVIRNGTTTIVVLDDDSKGVAKLHPDDKYDLEKGIQIAYAKARIKQHKKRLKSLCRY